MVYLENRTEFFFLRFLEVGKFKIKEFVGLMFDEFIFSHLKF